MPASAGRAYFRRAGCLPMRACWRIKDVSWLPSYGPEMRGGTANCHVIISDHPVGSPILNSVTTLIVMNGPSLEKFEESVVKGGLIIADSSLVDRKVARDDVETFEIPATKMASDMGNATFANIILLGSSSGGPAS